MFNSFRKSSHSGTHYKNERKCGRGRRLKFESLESRALLSAVSPFTTASLLAPTAIVASNSLSAQHVGNFAGAYTGSITGSAVVTGGGKTSVYMVSGLIQATFNQNGTFSGFAVSIPTPLGSKTSPTVTGTWTSANGSYAFVKGAGGGATVTGELISDSTIRGMGLWQYSATVSGYKITATGRWNIAPPWSAIAANFAGDYTGPVTGTAIIKKGNKTYVSMISTTVHVTVTSTGTFSATVDPFSIKIIGGTIPIDHPPQVLGTLTGSSANTTSALVNGSGDGVTAKGTLSDIFTKRGMGTWQYSGTVSGYTVTASGTWNIHV